MNKTIYLADDEPEIRNVIKEFLQNQKVDIEDFEDGTQLYEKFKIKKPDLVIMDIMMPNMSGFSLCKEIRKTSDVPIVMLTARDSDLDYKTAKSLGTDYYFTKPFSGVELSDKIQEILCNGGE